MMSKVNNSQLTGQPEELRPYCKPIDKPVLIGGARSYEFPFNYFLKRMVGPSKVLVLDAQTSPNRLAGP